MRRTRNGSKARRIVALLPILLCVSLAAPASGSRLEPAEEIAAAAADGCDGDPAPGTWAAPAPALPQRVECAPAERVSVSSLAIALVDSRAPPRD